MRYCLSVRAACAPCACCIPARVQNPWEHPGQKYPRPCTAVAASKPHGGVGTCYLVGAGPGDPELLTVRAAKLLQQAAVIVYDDLGAQDVLSLAAPEAERIYMGKRGGQPGAGKQQQIDQVLVQLCKEGKDVIRLKGGCPSVFSRVNSELSALKAAGVPYELVPGVSSAVAAPLAAGFPLTDARLSNAFAVATAHNPDALDWVALARMPTLVLLMGGSCFGQIVEKLLQHGKSPSTPVCVVQSATTPQQAVWHGCLRDIEDRTKGEHLSPCIIICGEVARSPA